MHIYRFKIKIFLGIFTGIFSLTLILSPRAAQATVWPGVDPAIQNGIDKIYDMLQGVIMGALKKAGATSIQMSVMNMVGGGNSGTSMFVTNYNDYLNVQPQQKAQQYMNDYLSQATRGKGSISGYISASSGGNGTGNFISGMTQGFGQNLGINNLKVNYQGNPSQMFLKGNFKNLNLYLSGINNPWAFNANAQSVYQKKLAEEKANASTKVIAGEGFTGNEKNGEIITPGSVIKGEVVNVEDIGNKVLASARSIPEVITAVISKMITKTISQGIGNIQVNVQRNSTNVQLRAGQAMQNQVQNQGPGAYYR